MRTRVTPTLATALLAAAVLSGCGLIPAAAPAVDAGDIEDTAEAALATAFDGRYRVDCGTGAITLVAGKQLDCVATNRDTQVDYAAAVEITLVSGRRYELEVELGEAVAEG